MPLAVLELNDTGIQVAIDGAPVRTSPGFAVLDGERLYIGESGMQHARLLPSWTNNRFWNQLNTDSLPNATPTTRHHADLAFAHLEDIWQAIKGDSDQVILLVPPFYDRAQLGLLLGMAKECGMPVAGVADSAVATAADNAIADTILHLDIFLHRIVLTTLSAGALLTRQSSETIADTGMFTFWDRWANIIAKQFIQTSRFDPMHEAGTEQVLFNRLPEWIAELGSNRSANFELETTTATHTVAVTADQLSGAGTQIYPQLVQAIRSHAGDGASLLLSHRFAGFPGLKDSLGLINNLDIVELPEDAALSGAFGHADKIVPADGGIQHVTSLPVTRRTSVSGTRTNVPTHLLLGDEAFPVGNAVRIAGAPVAGNIEDTTSPACTVHMRGGELNVEVHTGDIAVNGTACASSGTLALGDVLSVNGTDLRVIAVR